MSGIYGFENIKNYENCSLRHTKYICKEIKYYKKEFEIHLFLLKYIQNFRVHSVLSNILFLYCQIKQFLIYKSSKLYYFIFQVCAPKNYKCVKINSVDNYFPNGICYQINEDGKFEKNFELLNKPYISGTKYANAFSQLGMSLEYTEDNVNKHFAFQ